MKKIKTDLFSESTEELTYWERRLQAPIHKLYNENEKATQELLDAYESALKSIKSELVDLYDKTNVDDPMLSDMYRQGHLEAMESAMHDEIQMIGNIEETHVYKAKSKAIKDAGKVTADKLDIKWHEIPKKSIDAMVSRPWIGDSFSDNIWKNKSKLLAGLRNELTNGIIQGNSIYEISKRLTNRMDVGKSDAVRLVRTEVMNSLNTGQMEGYKQAGIQKVAVLVAGDERMCKICGKLTAEIAGTFDIDEAPHLPLHPHCRCTYKPIVDIPEETK